MSTEMDCLGRWWISQTMITVHQSAWFWANCFSTTAINLNHNPIRQRLLFSFPRRGNISDLTMVKQLEILNTVLTTFIALVFYGTWIEHICYEFLKRISSMHRMVHLTSKANTRKKKMFRTALVVRLVEIYWLWKRIIPRRGIIT